MESVRIVISAGYSEFKTFLDDFLFRLYGRQAKKAGLRNGNDFSTHLEYNAFGAMFDYKILVVEEGLDITLSFWANVLSDEDKENIQTHIEHVTQEIRNRFRSGNFPLGFKNLILDAGHSKLMEDLWIESEKTQKAKAFLSTIVILGSLLEGLLLYKIKQTPENTEKANRCNSSPKDSKTQKNLSFDKWSLSDMIIVSYKCGWINEYSYNYSESLRKHRNFVHPFQQLEELFTMPDENACELSRTAFKSIFNDLLKNMKEHYNID